MPSTRDGRPWGCSAVQAQPLPRQAEGADRLQIERLGGQLGLPGPKVESRGEVELSKLSPADRRVIEELFQNPEKIKPPAGAADYPKYRLTRHTAAGPETITVPYNAVPDVIQHSVRDTLK